MLCNEYMTDRIHGCLLSSFSTSTNLWLCPRWRHTPCVSFLLNGLWPLFSTSRTCIDLVSTFYHLVRKCHPHISMLSPVIDIWIFILWCPQTRLRLWSSGQVYFHNINSQWIHCALAWFWYFWINELVCLHTHCWFHQYSWWETRMMIHVWRTYGPWIIHPYWNCVGKEMVQTQIKNYCGLQIHAFASLSVRSRSFCQKSIIWRTIRCRILSSFFVHLRIFLSAMLPVDAAVVTLVFLQHPFWFALLPLLTALRMYSCTRIPHDLYLKTLSSQRYIGCFVLMLLQLYALCSRTASVTR